MKKMNTFIDLFAGIGGFRLALESLSLRCVFSSENDKYCQRVYYENFNEFPKDDVTKINAKDIPRHDILCAGFPCQSFSISGKRRGFLDVRGSLFFEILRIAQYHKPKVLFLENVSNFVKHNKGRTLSLALKQLKSLGYVAFFDVLNASLYGIPTARKRVYFVCFRKDLNIFDFEFPRPTFEKKYLKDFLDADDSLEIKRKALFFRKKKNFALRPIQIGKFNKGGQGERIYSINGHAITFSANGGGIAAKTGAYLIDEKIRKLTVCECARIMGFPQNFRMSVSKSQAYKQIGNSVVIPIIKSISKNILEVLWKKNWW